LVLLNSNNEKKLKQLDKCTNAFCHCYYYSVSSYWADTKFVFSYRVKGIAAPSIKLEKDYVEITKAHDGDRAILPEIARERNRFANNYCMEAE